MRSPTKGRYCRHPFGCLEKVCDRQQRQKKTRRLVELARLMQIKYSKGALQNLQITMIILLLLLLLYYYFYLLLLFSILKFLLFLPFLILCLLFCFTVITTEYIHSHTLWMALTFWIGVLHCTIAALTITKTIHYSCNNIAV